MWIVIQENSLDNQILGVFATMKEADAFMMVEAERFSDDTFSYGRYPAGWHR